MSVIVVEIDTRKGPYKTSFDSKPEDNNEQAKQFWKTLLLHPHIESSLYSKEISQVVKLNPLKETRNIIRNFPLRQFFLISFIFSRYR